MFSESFLLLSKNHDIPGTWSRKFCNFLHIHKGSGSRISHKYFWRNDEHVINMKSYLLRGGWHVENQRYRLREVSALVNLGNILWDLSDYFVVNQNFELEAHNLRQANICKELQHQSIHYNPTSNLLKWMSLKLSSWLNSESWVMVVTVEVWPLCSVPGAMFSLIETCLRQMKTDISIESHWYKI